MASVSSESRVGIQMLASSIGQSPTTLDTTPLKQNQLLLHEIGQDYRLHSDADVPKLAAGELLVEVYAIGLNPIDWKSAAFGFGIPRFPCLNGREFVGRIIAAEVDKDCHLKLGEMVLAVSTDYRDFRKAAFQEFAIVCWYNAIRIPTHVDASRVASTGVAFIAASIALGVCMGISFTKRSDNTVFNLLEIAQESPEELPPDIHDEIVHGISLAARAHTGEWLLIYGASTVTGQLAIQLAKLAVLRVVGVADVEKHRSLLESLGTDLLVDRMDLDETAKTVKQLINGSLRFAIDSVSPETAAWCQSVLASPVSSRDGRGTLSHLVALSGKPKTTYHDVRVHSVPVNLFHTNSKVGGRLCEWLHELLDDGSLRVPDVEFVDGGLGVVNGALAKLKAGKVSGRRLVVRTQASSPTNTAPGG